jgi:hypothetical protein
MPVIKFMLQKGKMNALGRPKEMQGEKEVPKSTGYLIIYILPATVKRIEAACIDLCG